jgi:hypothetical protein
VEVSPDVLQQVQVAFQQELPQLTTAYVAVSKADEISHEVIQEGIHVMSDGMQCTTCAKPGWYF